MAKRGIFQNWLINRWHNGISGYSYVIIYWTYWFVFLCLLFADICKVITTIPKVNTWNSAFAAWQASQGVPTFIFAVYWKQKINNKSWKLCIILMKATFLLWKAFLANNQVFSSLMPFLLNWPCIFLQVWDFKIL